MAADWAASPGRLGFIFKGGCSLWVMSWDIKARTMQGFDVGQIKSAKKFKFRFSSLGRPVGVKFSEIMACCF